VTCIRAATLASVDCRLAALLDRLDGATDAKTAERLSAPLRKARALGDEAATVGPGRPERKLIVRAVGQLSAFEARVGAAGRRIGKTSRQSLLVSSRELRHDLRAIEHAHAAAASTRRP